MANIKKNVFIVGLCIHCLSSLSFAIAPTDEELRLVKEWTVVNFGPEASALPFSFTYDGKDIKGVIWSQDIHKNWKSERSSRKLDENRTETTIKYTDPETGLEIRCVLVEYNDFPTVEWTVYFKNTGAVDTPILEDIQGMDFSLKRKTPEEYILHHFTGGGGGPGVYQPSQTILSPNNQEKFRGRNGRPTGDNMSYFNLEWSGQGMIIAVGWPGQWAGSFSRDGGPGLQIIAGQELTHCKLLPGEEIRSPLTVLQFWKGSDWIRSQNIWRRWMLKHNIPRPGGKLPSPKLGAWIVGYGAWMFNSQEKDHLMFMERYIQEDIKLDYWWMELGWFIWPDTVRRAHNNLGIYIEQPDESSFDLDKINGFTPDYHRFPNGLAPISDFANTHGTKTVLWLEPEHIWGGQWQEKEHPEWLLFPSKIPGIEKQVNQGLSLGCSKCEGKGHRMLFNLGHPEALQWLNQRVDQALTEQGSDVYRLDFNLEPLIFWKANDTENRQGITENHYIQGLLTHMDDLQRRHPNLLIDNCASGGQRNDLESMRRTVALWRSDATVAPVAMQSMTHGIAFWFPYFGHVGGQLDPYTFRSNMYPSVLMTHDVRKKNFDWDYLRKMVGQWRTVAPYYMGDYYPLTPDSLKNGVWMAWQFDKPDLDAGMVQAFRRENCYYEAARFKLRGMEPKARYLVRDFDREEPQTITGKELMEEGLLVVIPDEPGAAVITYKKLEK